MDKNFLFNLKMPACTINSDGTILLKNPLFSEMINGADEDSLKLDSEHPFYAEYRKRLAMGFTRALGGNECKCLAVLKSSGGSQIPVEIHLLPIDTENNSPGILALFKKVDPKRIGSFISFDMNAMSINDNSIADNTNLFDFSPIPIIRMDSNKEFIALSNSIESISGTSRAELIENPDKLYKLLSSYDFERIKKNISEILSGNASFKRVNDLIITSTKKEEKHLNAVLYPVLHDKKIVGADIIFEDITKVKKLEKKLSELNRALIIRNLTKGLLHSLNNIINIVLNKSQILASNAGSIETSEGLKIIGNTAFKGAEQIKRIQQFLEESSENQENQKANILDIIQDSIEFANINFRVEKKEKKRFIRIIKNYYTKFDVVGNTKLLKEIVVSLIFKIAHYVGKSGTIEIALREKGDIILSFTVKKDSSPQAQDYSPGYINYMPEVEIRRVAEKMNIRILEEESNDTLSIKAIIPSKMVIFPEKKEEETTVGVIRDRSILIIEDEPAISDILGDLFRSMGNNVMIINNTIDGLRAFNMQNYNIVISDYGFDELNGIDLLSKIKSAKSETITVLTSGWLIPKNSSNEKIVDLFIEKPFRIEHLIKELSRIISERGA